MIIAIDGPAASGKGTLARKLAAHFALPHLDTGLLYRATAKALLDQGHRLNDTTTAAAIARNLRVDEFAEDRLRGQAIGEAASIVAAAPEVRLALAQLQHDFAGSPQGAVLDGRDIGTIICPHADVKIFVTASPEARAARRVRELQLRGETPELDRVLADILRRDARDRGREDAPLRAAADACLLDTTTLGVGETFAKALQIVDDRLHHLLKNASA